jgi:hypothetical protein
MLASTTLLLESGLYDGKLIQLLASHCLRQLAYSMNEDPGFSSQLKLLGILFTPQFARSIDKDNAAFAMLKDLTCYGDLFS